MKCARAMSSIPTSEEVGLELDHYDGLNLELTMLVSGAETILSVP